MPGTPATTARHAIPRIATTDTDDVPRDLNAAVDRIDVTAPVFISGLASARPAAGIADRYHYATDTGELTRDTGSAWVGPLNPRTRTLQTTLPGSPFTGQEILFQDTAVLAPANIVWSLRYDGTKWVPIGGATDLYSEVTALVNLGSTAGTWQDLAASNGPDITVPLAGDYDISFGALLQMAVNAATVSMGVAIGAASTPGGNLAQVSQTVSGVASTESVSVMTSDRITVASASTLLRCRYQWLTANSPANGAGARWLRVRPVRVG